jgi:uncharacterized protein (TIGR00255 family)
MEYAFVGSEGMLSSMTGYGRAEDTELICEIRSVNNRFLDVNVRTPRGFMALDDPLRKCVSQRLSRGKVDVVLTLSPNLNKDNPFSLSPSAVRAYLEAAQALRELGVKETELSAEFLLNAPAVLSAGEQRDCQSYLPQALTLCADALDALSAARVTEGEFLKLDLLAKLTTLESSVAQVKAKSPETVLAYRKKLEDKLKEVLQNTELDDARILTEATIYADKVAVDEETVRLSSHISNMRHVLDTNEPVGRKLDFLVQEMGREVNTIGSKAADTEIVNIVLGMKNDLEKIREQVQNIE